MILLQRLQISLLINFSSYFQHLWHLLPFAFETLIDTSFTSSKPNPTTLLILECIFAEEVMEITLKSTSFNSWKYFVRSN